MARLAPERLLYTFRVNAGLPVGSATPLGGWEQPENGKRSSELRGHFVGHFLSASALLYASTGATDVKAKADSMVTELARCQERLGGTYLSAFPTTWWDRLEAGQRVWAPFYTIHKIMAGMFDMYRLAGNTQALEVLERMAAWADGWTAPKTDEQMQQILAVEFGGIAETLYNLAASTGNDRWATVGDRFQKKSFINPLALRRDELRGLHANTHIPQAIAAARRYEISGDTRFRDVADYFFHEVSDARSYVTGGTSNAEGWLSPPRQLASEWRASANTAECCCAYNMLKLSRHLYGWEPRAEYFDYYERLLLNHRIGTIRPNVGTTQYYLSLTPGVWKTFNTEDQTFWCCTGTGIEEYAKLADSIYWRDDDGVYVNLFIASELDWPEESFMLRQETKYPEAEQHGPHHRQDRASSADDSTAHPAVAPVVTPGDAQWSTARRIGDAWELSDAHASVEGRRPCGDGPADAPARGVDAGRAGHAGVSLRAAGPGRRPWQRRPHGSTHRRTESARRSSRRRTTRLAPWTGQSNPSDAGRRDPDVSSRSGQSRARGSKRLISREPFARSGRRKT